MKNEVKYLDLILTQNSPGNPILYLKRSKLTKRFRCTSCSAGHRKWKIKSFFTIMSLNLYGRMGYNCSKPSNSKIIQRVQSKMWRMMLDAPWYVENKTIHDGLRIPSVEEEIHTRNTNYLRKLPGQQNKEISQLVSGSHGA